MNLVILTIHVIAIFVIFNTFSCTAEAHSNTIPKVIEIIEPPALEDTIEVPNEFLKELFDKHVDKILTDGPINRFWETFVDPKSNLIPSFF